MKKVIYPGTFDPITFGHIDLIKKALNIFDNLIIAISDGNNKEYLFSAEEREYLVKKSLFSVLKFKTIFLMSDPQNQIISSKLVKEIADLKGNVKKFTTITVLKHLKLKLND